MEGHAPRHILRGERLDLLPDATKELATATPLLSMCRAALKHPTVEPAFRTPQEKPPEQLQLKSLPSSITRFLYLHEVEGLLGRHAGRDEEALAVEQAALVSSEAESECNSLSPRSEEAEPNPTLRTPSSLESALCLGELCMH